MSHENNETHSFRFLKAGSELVEAIRQHEPTAEIRWRGEAATVSFALCATKSYEWMRGISSSFGLASEDFGVFVSLVTEYDSEMVSLPPYILELTRVVGGHVVFSVTFVFV